MPLARGLAGPSGFILVQDASEEVSASRTIPALFCGALQTLALLAEGLGLPPH